MITPYLLFSGRCEEAMRFYQRVFGVQEMDIRRYEEYVPEGLASVPKDLANWILHGEMNLCGTKVWFADEPQGCAVGSNIALTVSIETTVEARCIVDAFKETGEVLLPATETFYSQLHASVRDQFGIVWNIVSLQPPGIHAKL